jgi:hypothetical protein
LGCEVEGVADMRREAAQMLPRAGSKPAEKFVGKRSFSCGRISTLKRRFMPNFAIILDDVYFVCPLPFDLSDMFHEICLRIFFPICTSTRKKKNVKCASEPCISANKITW